MDLDRRMLTDLVLARSTLDRAAHLRSDASWQSDRREDPRSRVMWVTAGAVAMTPGGDRLMLASADLIPDACEVTFLGLDDHDVAYFCAHLDQVEEAQVPPDTRWASLREVASTISDRDSGMVVTAIALDNWTRTHPRCSRCGTATESADAGWSRRCPQDDFVHFPRTDPAIIVLVLDAEDRALLGRQARWEPGWFSTLAGFVESGESAEAAVRREVFEESGVRIGDDHDAVVYLGSQPWPFPCSLMLGYHAWAVDSVIEVDGDEIAEARWFTRQELAAACAAGEVRLPPPVSIARRLIERWYGADLPGDWSRPIAR